MTETSMITVSKTTERLVQTTLVIALLGFIVMLVYFGYALVERSVLQQVNLTIQANQARQALLECQQKLPQPAPQPVPPPAK